jgi:hypothetical protein
MDDETRRIAMLNAAFEDEPARLHGTVEKSSPQHGAENTKAYMD